MCSPLRRTLQTAVRVFGEEVPFLAAECAREYSQGHARPCDCRRERRLQEADFRADFSQVPEGWVLNFRYHNVETIVFAIHQKQFQLKVTIEFLLIILLKPLKEILKQLIPEMKTQKIHY